MIEDVVKPAQVAEHSKAAGLGRDILPALILLVILGVAAYLRFTGLNWDEYTHIHPDERFLTMVETAIQPPASISQYFRTDESPLNPHNVGHRFFVYGTLPIFLVRYVAEWMGMTGYDEIHLVGRALSGAFDLVSVLLVYLIGARLYRRRVGLLAAALAGLSVLLIQHAHFFVVDPFANTFILAGLYFAVLIQDEGRPRQYAYFGVAVGMAVASKISAAPLAGLAVLAAASRMGRSSDPEARADEVSAAIRNLVVAGVLAFLAFRVFQPYAFEGTSFFDIRPNSDWLANLSEIRRQSSGEVDFPPALQWADRTPVLFAFRNLVLWGMGAPLGILAWAAWAWALVQTLRGRWRRHLIPVIWTGGYFLWQSVGFTPAMRYQMPVYPTLTILAAWGLWEAWDRVREFSPSRRDWFRAGIAGVMLAVLASTAAYAFAFTSIYTNPVTRVAASRWIFANLPGPVNIVLETASGTRLEPIAVPHDFTLVQGQDYNLTFTSPTEGTVTFLAIPFVTDLTPGTGPKRIEATLWEGTGSEAFPLSTGVYEGELPEGAESRIDLPLDQPVTLQASTVYALKLHVSSAGALFLRGQVEVNLLTAEGAQIVPVPIPHTESALGSSSALHTSFVSRSSGTARTVLLPYVTVLTAGAGERLRVRALLEAGSGDGAPMGSATIEGPVPAGEESRLELLFDRPIELTQDQTYSLRIEVLDGAALSFRGSVIVNETGWDDGLPLRIDGRDGYAGLYTGVSQELYWPDDQDDDGNGVSDKLERIVETLSEGDYLTITSNRQYGSIARVPQRYPLTTAYYRALLSCPEPEAVAACAARAKPGQLEAGLGYNLVAVFESNPRLGPIEFGDQLAEEAFTVYDHPKVLIFARSSDFTPEAVYTALGGVDVGNVAHLLPNQLGASSPSLLLPPERWQTAQTLGTWSDLFDRGALLNSSEPVAVVAWWLFLALVGLLVFPLVHATFGGLQDKGYPIARLLGLLLVAWISWLLGSLGVPFRAATIGLTLLTLGLVGGAFAWRDRAELQAYFHRKRKEIVWVEVLALGLFALDLAIRLGNPDLWHPSKGGEKPMDFSYLNAVIKSATFPPFDPWFAGGYINYYYFGFVLVGAPIKLLGLVPSLAYNLVIPTLFALSGLAAYSVASNLVGRLVEADEERWWTLPRIGGLAAAAGLVLLGNLGTVRLIYDGLKQVGAGAGQETAGFLGGAYQALLGLFRVLTLDGTLPYGIDAWYWNPSRAIPPAPGEVGPITEFPFFTFLYADLHAHMIALPLTVLGLAWALAWLQGAASGERVRWHDLVMSLLIGGVIFGSLRATNTWDFPVYLGLGALAVLGGAWVRRKAVGLSTILEGVLGAVGLVALAVLTFLPYARWYGQGYTTVDMWEGSRTPLDAYFTIHGLFLFVILGWMVWESRQWMAATPISALEKLRPAFGYLAAFAFALLAGVTVLVVTGFQIALVVFPFVVWAGVLFLRPGMAVEKRFVLALAAAAASLTFVVDVVVLRGDIGRMNTVFKFYLQVWTMFSLAAGAALAWLLAEQRQWAPNWRSGWSALLGVLVVGALLYPLTAAPSKIRDRWVKEAPFSLDGMAFMPYATWHDLGQSYDLSSDYRAIQWMQENVEGSPVIVEANTPEYRWGSRFTIYTGLPGVLGWNWHQRQQRVVMGDQHVTERAFDIAAFYASQSLEDARIFLETYNVEYVIVGGLERLYYETVQPCWTADETAGFVTCDMNGRPIGMLPPAVPASACTPLSADTPEAGLSCPTRGLEKFDRMVSLGILRVAYQDGMTVIYEVIAP